MTRVLIDSSAWIEYLFGTKLGEKARKLIENSGNTCFTPNIVKTEVISKIIRSGHNAENAVKIIKELSFTPVEEAETYFNAGKIHAEAKRTNPGMSPADAIILAIAESNKCTILTNDHHLKRTNTILLG